MQLPPNFPEAHRAPFENTLKQGATRTPEEMRMGVKVHLSRVAKHAREGVQFDEDVAVGIGQGLLQLLELPMDEEPDRSWILAAVMYYVSMDDDEPDFTPGGFQDDAEVFNAVARALGKENLVVKT